LSLAGSGPGMGLMPNKGIISRELSGPVSMPRPTPVAAWHTLTFYPG